MHTIVDWDRDSSQWSAVLKAAARGAGGAGVTQDLPGNSLWPLYAPLAQMAADQDFVIGQLGQSLDGRIATPTGHSHYINGKAAIAHLHRLRALVDAVVVGVGTVIADDPQLTVRHAHINKAQPARVVIDPSGRMPATARCLAADGARRIVVRRNDAAAPHVDSAEILTVAASDGILAPRAILDALKQTGLRRILIEGGAWTLSQFLAAECLDRLHLMTAPMIIGSGPIGIQLPAIDKLDQAQRPCVTTFVLPEGDILSDCAFT